MSDHDSLAELHEKRETARKGGRSDRVERQHEAGKLTASERIDYLLDDDTFVEIGPFVEHDCTNFGMDARTVPGDAVVAGHGEVEGRPVVVFAHDFTVFGGSVSAVVAERIIRVVETAADAGVPVVGLNDSGGARIQEGVESLHGFARLFRNNTTCSGVVPQISCIMGPCAGGAVYSPALTDFTFMVEGTAHMMITGPDVVETVTGEEVTMEQLGGARAHTGESGVAHKTFESDEAALDSIRTLLSYLPANNMEDPPRVATRDDATRREEFLRDVVPESPETPYDMTEILDGILDRDSWYELHENYARNVLVGFARLDGHSVGVVANQPRIRAGTLDIAASEKAARFVRFCDGFNIPILTFVDVPGFMPGTDQEHGGIIKHGAKLIYAYGEATVPLLTVITRKAYGGAYIVMASKGLGADVNLAWPTAELAVMGPKGAVDVLYKQEIVEASDPEARRQALIEEYREEFATPYPAAENGFIDDVIDPRDTRPRLVRELRLRIGKRATQPPRDHGNIPL